MAQNENLSNLQVSAQTAQYVKALDQLAALWAQLNETTASQYGSEETFNRDFCPVFAELEERIKKHLYASIIEHRPADHNSTVI